MDQADPAARLRWVMWGIPALLFLVAFVHRAAPGVIAKDIMHAFNASGAIVGLLSATYFYAYAGFMVPAGLAIDGFGPRRVIAAGSAIMGLGSVLMGLAAAPTPLFAGRFLVGLGATVTFIGTLKIAASWFPPSHFGTLSAVTATVGVLGALISTAPLAVLVAAVGWRRAFVIIGLLTVAGAVLCFAVVRDYPREHREADRQGPSLGAVLSGMVEVFSNRHTWPPFLGFFFLYAATGNLFLWSVPYLKDVYALSTTRAAVYAAAVSVALLFSAPLTGYVSDRVVKRRKLPYTVLTGVSFLLWVVLVATLGMLPLWGVYGLFLAMGTVGSAFVLTWPLGREVNPPPLAGIAVAVANLGGFLGAALSQGPVGWVLDTYWAGAMAEGARVYPLEAYRAAFRVCALFILTSFALSFFLRETRGENIYHELRRPLRASESRTS